MVGVNAFHENPVALVTGGARGIGRSYVERLEALNYQVVAIDLRFDHDASGSSPDGSGSSEPVGVHPNAERLSPVEVVADASDFHEMRSIADLAIQRFGRLDVAVCNAGGGSGEFALTLASKLDRQITEEVVDRNLMSTISLCNAVVPYMKNTRRGRIVTVSSHGGHLVHPSGGYANYSAAKAAVEMYTRTLAQEVGPYGIRVNCIAPGHIATARVIPIIESMSAQIEETIALRRVGVPEDCANVLEFLVSPLSDYMTGAVLPVDGGSHFVNFSAR